MKVNTVVLVSHIITRLPSFTDLIARSCSAWVASTGVFIGLSGAGIQATALSRYLLIGLEASQSRFASGMILISRKGGPNPFIIDRGSQSLFLTFLRGLMLNSRPAQLLWAHLGGINLLLVPKEFLKGGSILFLCTVFSRETRCLWHPSGVQIQRQKLLKRVSAFPPR